MTERVHGIAGSMFSGKTDELIRLINREEVALRKVQVFKPAVDTRYNALDKIKSHSGAEHAALRVASSVEILNNLDPDTKVVAIDEIQFFDPLIVDVVNILSQKDIKVLFAGLPLDFKAEDFGQMPKLLVRADKIERLTAICTYMENGEMCRADATRTQRFLPDGSPANYNDPIVEIGERDKYAARCPNHHVIPGKPENKLPNQ